MARVRSARADRTAGSVNPVPDAEFARIDQGVDYLSNAPVRALRSGRIVRHSGGMAGGTGDILEERYDEPVHVDGRTYYGGYYSEERPLVKTDEHVQAGDPVMAPGSNEVGFLEGTDLQFPPLIGGLGAGTQPTQAGRDFATYVRGLGGPDPGFSAPRVRGKGWHTVTVPPTTVTAMQARSHGTATTDSTTQPFQDTVGTSLVDRWHGSSGGFLDGILQGVPILGPIIGSVDGVASFLKLAVWIVDPFNWLRLFEAIIGAILMTLGLVGLGVVLASRSSVVKEAAGAAQLAPGPVGAAGRAVTLAGEARSPQTRRRILADRLPQRHAERAATQQGEREERQSQRRAAIAAARASGRRRAQAARTRQSADRFGEVPF